VHVTALQYNFWNRRVSLLHARYQKCENMLLSFMNRPRRNEIFWNGFKFAKEM